MFIHLSEKTCIRSRVADGRLVIVSDLTGGMFASMTQEEFEACTQYDLSSQSVRFLSGTIKPERTEYPRQGSAYAQGTR